MRQQALWQLLKYLRLNPGEANDLRALTEQLSQDGNDVFSRSNMRGHITGSALVVNEDLTQVLLIHHLALDRWLQPGGHVEISDSILESAIREVAEETGVTNVSPYGVLPGTSAEEVVPFDIDTHLIPANPKKGEGEHWHHDFVYLLQVKGPVELVMQPEEVKGVRWAPLDELKNSGAYRFERMVKKLEAYKG